MSEIIVISRDELEKILEEKIRASFQSKLSAEEEKKDEYLTRDEAAQYLKVSTATIDNYRSRGLIRSYRIGSSVRIKRSELNLIQK